MDAPGLRNRQRQQLLREHSQSGRRRDEGKSEFRGKDCLSGRYDYNLRNRTAQYLKEYFDAWLERNRDIAPEVTLEIVQNESQAKSRERSP